VRAGLLTFVAALSASAAARAEDARDITVTGDTPYASSRVTRRDLDERLPRSAPDALRWEPGVFVQQTGHGQASVFIRGRTGQQTVLIFDGIRVNNSTYRQGPNQYLFTVDPRSIRSLETIRGGSSTLWGSDAIAGVVHAHPIEPTFDDTRTSYFRPRAMLRFGTADGEFGERFQLDAQLSPVLQAIAGFGFRRVGPLRSGGVVVSPENGEAPQVPAFGPDGRTMLGTGFKEITADGRAIYRLGEESRLVAATYVYRQYDSPRTDQCPPAFAPRSECLTFEEQFRTLAYVAYEGAFGRLFPAARLALSYQRQHERRRRDRPSVLTQNGGRDDVDTYGITAFAESRAVALGESAHLRATVGGDAYFDSIRSQAWTRFTDLDLTIAESRGQYMSGSRYSTGGVFTRLAATIAREVGVQAGARLGVASANTPGDARSTTVAIDRAWLTHAAFTHLEWNAVSWLSLLASYDRSFRAPNLDDLTSRQQTGPGFQFENAALRPEVADTFEAGVRARNDWLAAEAWVFRSIVHDAITRTVRAASDCPALTPQCGNSWNRFQLINIPGASTIDGVELAARVRLPRDVTVRATLAYAYGRGPNPQEKPSDPRLPYEQEVPLSRISPLNGTLETRWSPTRGWFVAAGLRWATAQTRLAPSDRSDARIPLGGTPGFAVVDLRAGVRVDRNFLVTAILENIADAAYRYHGSSINSPGRSVLVALEAGL
jgi:outer membrane receptor protein involved in Fe transport